MFYQNFKDARKSCNDLKNCAGRRMPFVQKLKWGDYHDTLSTKFYVPDHYQATVFILYTVCIVCICTVSPTSFRTCYSVVICFAIKQYSTVHFSITAIKFRQLFNIPVVAPHRICNVLVVLVLCMITWSPLHYLAGQKNWLIILSLYYWFKDLLQIWQQINQTFWRWLWKLNSCELWEVVRQRQCFSYWIVVKVLYCCDKFPTILDHICFDVDAYGPALKSSNSISSRRRQEDIKLQEEIRRREDRLRQEDMFFRQQQEEMNRRRHQEDLMLQVDQCQISPAASSEITITQYEELGFL